MLETIMGILLGFLICYLVLKPKLEKTQNNNDKIKAETLRLEEEKEQIIQKIKDNDAVLAEQMSDLHKFGEEVVSRITKVKGLDAQIETLESRLENDKKSREMFLKFEYKEREDMEKETQRLTEEEIEKWNNIYFELMKSCVKDFEKEIQKKEEELEQVKEDLAYQQSLVLAAVEASKREEELRSNVDFYRLQMEEQDLQDIKRLKEVLPYIKKPDALLKAIYKSYYEKPYTDMVGRVLGNEPHTGIYKITNLENNMCYVGQCVSAAERWKQHIRRGMGADTPTQNKLYPAMQKYGVENFTFELLEECPREELNDREKFWTDYFKAQEYGYSIRKG